MPRGLCFYFHWPRKTQTNYQQLSLRRMTNSAQFIWIRKLKGKKMKKIMKKRPGLVWHPLWKSPISSLDVQKKDAYYLLVQQYSRWLIGMKNRRTVLEYAMRQSLSFRFSDEAVIKLNHFLLILCWLSTLKVFLALLFILYNIQKLILSFNLLWDAHTAVLKPRFSHICQQK